MSAAPPPGADAKDISFDVGPGGTTVLLDGHPQSHVDLEHPDRLEFEYVAQMAAVIEALLPGAEPLAATHVGGAGLTLPRWLQHTRPGSTQVVLEPAEALTAAVRRELPLPRGHRIRVRAQDGRTGVAALRDASAQLLVVDAFAGGRVPAELQTATFLGDCARVLRPEGLLLMNVADERGLRHVLRVVATLRTAFPQVAVVALHEVLKAKRFGNAVLVAATALDVDTLERQVRRLPLPTGVWSGPALERRLAGVAPFADDAVPSPTPPELGVWRVR